MHKFTIRPCMDVTTDVPKRRVSRQLEEVSGSAVSSLTPRQTIVGPGPSFPNSGPSAVSTCLIVTVSRVVSSIHLHWLCKHCLCTCLITPRVLSYFLYSMLPSQWLLSSNVKCQKVDYDGFEFYKPWLKFQTLLHTQSIIFEKEEVNIETYLIQLQTRNIIMFSFEHKNT